MRLKENIDMLSTLAKSIYSLSNFGDREYSDDKNHTFSLCDYTTSIIGKNYLSLNLFSNAINELICRNFVESYVIEEIEDNYYLFTIIKK